MREFCIALMLLSVCLTTIILPVYANAGHERPEINATDDFTLEIAPSYNTVNLDRKIKPATYTIQVKALSGFRGEVELSIDGLPESAEAIFNPEEGIPRPVFASVLKISVSPSTPADEFNLTITGSSKDTVHYATATLVIQGESITTPTKSREERLKVTVSTSQENYQKGSTVDFFGHIKLHSGESDEGAAVSLNVIDPLGNETHVSLISADRFGRYSDKFTLPMNATDGTYSVYVAAGTGGKGLAKATFTVGTSQTPSINMANVTITTTNGTVSSEFHAGDTIAVWVAANNGGADLRDGRAWIEILDPNNTPIDVAVLGITVREGEKAKTGIQIVLKSDAPEGIYIVRCFVSNASIMSGGRFLDMKETAFVVT